MNLLTECKLIVKKNHGTVPLRKHLKKEKKKGAAGQNYSSSEPKHDCKGQKQTKILYIFIHWSELSVCPVLKPRKDRGERYPNRYTIGGQILSCLVYRLPNTLASWTVESAPGQELNPVWN